MTLHRIGSLEPPACDKAASDAKQQGVVAYRYRRNVTLHYRYTNRQQTTLELWLAIPPELPTQREVSFAFRGPQPEHLTIDVREENRIAYMRLQPAAHIDLTITARLYEARYVQQGGAALALPPDHREYYLRSSPMIHLSDEVHAEAARLVEGANAPYEQVRRLALHLRQGEYRYVYPPSERGSEAMRRDRVGDCGQYAMLYAAWCRSLGIPCRVMIGSWAMGRQAAHVWNEVFLDGVGWLPVDTSAPDADRRVRTRFGSQEADRITFSIDPDLILFPTYTATPAPSDGFTIMLGGQPVAWGYELLADAAPYLQPVYLRFGGAANITSDEDLLGSWYVALTWRERVLTWATWAGFSLGAFGFLLAQVGFPWAASASFVAWTTGYAAFLVRTGMTWWKTALLILLLAAMMRWLWG